MAWGRHAPRAAEAERPFVETTDRIDPAEDTVADTERLGVDLDVTDRPARAWEVDEVNSWEPVVPDTWDPPVDADVEASTDDEATWTDAARSEGEWTAAGANVETAARNEREWADADAEIAARNERGWAGAGDTAPSVPPGEPVRPADRAAMSAGDEAVRSPNQAPAGRIRASELAKGPARMALGLASLAAERMRAGVPAGDGLITGFGVMRQAANELLGLGQRLMEPASRAAAGAVKGTVRGAASLPIAGMPVRAAMRTGDRIARSGVQAREKLRAAIATSIGDGQSAQSTREGEGSPGRRR